MKNYEVIGFEYPHGPVEPAFQGKFESTKKELEGLARGCPRALIRRARLETLLIWPCWKHMGFIELPDITPELKEGLKLAVEYLHGDWWTEETVRRIERESPDLLRLSQWIDVDSVIAENLREMDRSNPECEYKWREVLRIGLLFGGLLEEWDEVKHLCSALDAEVRPEYSAGTLVDEYFYFYLCIAGRLSGQWTEGMQGLLDKVKQSRLKRIQQCVAAWEDAVAGNQAGFNKTFKEALKSFIKRKDDPSEFMLVALDETVIWLIARMNGLSFPDLPDKLRAVVMTRESLGLT